MIFPDSLRDLFEFKALGSILKHQAVYVRFSFSSVWEHGWVLEGRAVSARGCAAVALLHEFQCMVREQAFAWA